jgi:hypothetical protein
VAEELPPVKFSEHAALAYADRVKESLTEDGARAELAYLLSGAMVQPDPPPWVTIREQRGDSYLVLSPDLCCPLVAQASGAMIAVTVLARAHLGDTERRQRSEHKASTRRDKRFSKAAARGGRARRPRRQPEAGEWGS